MTSITVIEIVAYLQELKEDSDATKALKSKIDEVVSVLNSNSELAIGKALLVLEEINSLDLSSYHRTQVWDVISLLESTKTR